MSSEPDEREFRIWRNEGLRSSYDALSGEDGTLAPFAAECERRENGSTSVGGNRPAPKPQPESKPADGMRLKAKAIEDAARQFQLESDLSLLPNGSCRLRILVGRVNQVPAFSFKTSGNWELKIGNSGDVL